MFLHNNMKNKQTQNMPWKQRYRWKRNRSMTGRNIWHILRLAVEWRQIHVPSYDVIWNIAGNKNSENCGPPLGNKFDLEVGQRSPSRSRHGTIGKVLSQGTHMPSIKALSVIAQKLCSRLKFLWQTDRQTDRQTDEWDLMSPRFRESGGQQALTPEAIRAKMMIKGNVLAELIWLWFAIVYRAASSIHSCVLPLVLRLQRVQER